MVKKTFTMLRIKIKPIRRSHSKKDKKCQEVEITFLRMAHRVHTILDLTQTLIKDKITIISSRA